MFPNTKERIDKELSLMVSASTKINVIAPNERKFSVWMGGSVLATLATF